MNERPILFSTPMVQAILAGRKTQTRRICKHQNWSYSELHDVNTEGITQKADRNVSCPYGQIGDLLWVRETFSIYRDAYLFKADEPHIFKGIKYKPSIHMPRAVARIWLKVIDIKIERLQQISKADAVCEGIKRHFNPLFKEIRFADYTNKKSEWRDSRSSFKSLWDSINGKTKANKPSYPWETDPWVWVVEFKVISTTGKPEAL